MHRRLALSLLLAALGATGQAAEDMDLEGMAVTGNQELPKSLTIVPWKASGLGDIAGLPTGSLLNEHLGPVQREVFQRELRYYDSVHGTE
ncbi:MAG: hypothetical protein K8I04_14050 [Gammaproteobacteria bacterium]|nr:hypothetical protein [Gammaproteobacteria bacterium]